MTGISVLVCLILLGLILFIVGKCRLNCSQISPFTFNNSEYQYGNPNLMREWYYYKCMDKDCGGQTHDYLCLEKCHLKAYRAGMMEKDIKDMVCQPYSSDEDAYYRCLDSVYADYKYP